MPNRIRNPILVLVFTIFALSGVQRANAMIVLAVDLPNLIIESDTIVQGVVMHLDNVVLDKNGQRLDQENARDLHKTVKDSGMKAFTDISILVNQNFQGETPAGKILKIRLVGGKIGQYTLAVPGMPTFRPKEEVVLFLEKTPQGLTPMGAAQGVFRVERENETPPIVYHDLQGVAVMRRGSSSSHGETALNDAGEYSNSMGEGLPAIPDRMPLATLRDHIHAMLGIVPVKAVNIGTPKIHLQRR